jgi:hypothetical protein
MKRLFSGVFCILLSFMFAFVFHFKAKAQEKFFYAEQADTIFQNLDKNFITTGILYDRAFPLSRFDFYNPSTDTATFKFASQAYYELYQAHYNRSVLLDPNLMMDMVEYLPFAEIKDCNTFEQIFCCLTLCIFCAIVGLFCNCSHLTIHCE